MKSANMSKIVLIWIFYITTKLVMYILYESILMFALNEKKNKKKLRNQNANSR